MRLKEFALTNLADLNRAFCYETIQEIILGEIFAGSFRFGSVRFVSMWCAPAFKALGKLYSVLINVRRSLRIKYVSRFSKAIGEM
jgi:hypothetical protein